MTEKEAYLILNTIPGLDPVKITRLFEQAGGAASVFKVSDSAFSGIEGINRGIIERIRSWHKYFDLAKEVKLIEKHNVKIITIKDNDYPRLLREVYDPPVVLYTKGSLLPEDWRAIAIVGARRASYYGLNTANKLAKQLADRGITIVSGFARGVDTSAHQGVVAAGGRTIAVFGCGIDIVYPSENKKLTEDILKNGVIMTEFPFGTPPNKYNFPKRNRIISGLSLGVIVIEAGRYSGSLITARLASEQGREVFSVPGRIDTAASEGTNILIKNGAKLVLNIEDIVEELKCLHYFDNKADEKIMLN